MSDLKRRNDQSTGRNKKKLNQEITRPKVVRITVDEWVKKICPPK